MQKRILVTTSTYPRWKNDPTPSFVHYLSEHLSKHFDIIVLAPHYPGCKKKERQGKITIYRFQYFFPASLQRLCYGGGVLANVKASVLAKLQIPFFLASQFFAQWRLAKKEKIDLVHAHWIVPQGYIAALVKMVSGVPYVTTAHAGDIFPLRNGFFRLFGKTALKHAHVCTVNSKATQRAITSLHKGKTSIIPMGVDTSIFKPVKTKKKWEHSLHQSF